MNIDFLKKYYNNEFFPLYKRILKGTTSICKYDSEIFRAHGTGNYLKFNDNFFLLTNEHVQRKARENNFKLAHIPNLENKYEKIENGFLTQKHPLDFGITKVTNQFKKCSKITFEDDFDTHFNPVQGEHLFWIGYPATTKDRDDRIEGIKTRDAHFNYIDSPAVPFSSTEHNETEIDYKEFDSNHHFALKFPKKTVFKEIETNDILPNPTGLSGSFVWDTKYIKSQRDGIPWSPDLAKICGLIFLDFYEQDLLFATRIEKIKENIIYLATNYDGYFK